MNGKNICPLLSTKEDRVPCLLKDCAWFLQTEGQPDGKGECGIVKIASNLFMIHNKFK